MVKSELGGVTAISEGDDAARFARLRGKALAKVEFVLDLPNDLESFGGDMLMQHRRIRMQLDAAQSVIADSIKVDENTLRAQQHEDALELLRQRVEMAEKKLPKPRSGPTL